MTWLEFKTWLESKGVRDNDKINYIDVASRTADIQVIKEHNPDTREYNTWSILS